MKEPSCKICGGRHYKFQCWRNPRKKIQSKNPLKPQKTVVKSTKASKTINKPQSKQDDRQRAIKRLDSLCSEIVRRRGANSIGENWCYTCGVKKNWKELDCGHFYSRRFLNTRWNLQNMKPQCQFCNRNLGGNLKIYESKLRLEFGDEEVDKLGYLARSGNKLYTFELLELEEKLKNIKKNLDFCK